MKKSEKLVALLLSVIMLLGMFAVTTSAEDAVVEEETADGIANVTIQTSADIVKPGDVITVTVNVSTDYDALSMRWPVLFSSSFFEFVEDSNAPTEEMTVLGGRFTVVTNETDGKVFTSEHTPDEYQCVAIQWLGVGSQKPISYNKPDGMGIYTFSLKVKNDVEMGESGEILLGNENEFYTQMLRPGVENPTLTNGGIFNGNITFNCTKAVVAYPVPDIVPAEGTSTVVDKEAGIIRGIDLNVVDNIDDYIDTVCCEIEITYSQENKIGTGTKVTLTYEGEFWKEYTVVIAGDVNGDANIDVLDYITLDLAEASEITLADSELLAGDLNGDVAVTSADKLSLDAYMIFAGEIDQATGRYIPNN